MLIAVDSMIVYGDDDSVFAVVVDATDNNDEDDLCIRIRNRTYSL